MDEHVPPMYPNPPPLVPPLPDPRSSRQGRGWMVFSLVLLALVVLLLAGNSVRWLRNFYGAGPATLGKKYHGTGLLETTVEDHNSRNKIAVIEITGLITGEYIDAGGRNLVELLKDQFKMAAEDGAVKAVLLRVDSPGGEVMAADTMYQAIADFQKDSLKPVIASMGGLAASGGYYVSAPCQWIVAHELTITGSIGVIMHGFNYRGLLDKVGVRPVVFKSGRFKDMLSGTKAEEEILPEERRIAQDLINQTFARFKTVVKKGRDQASKLNAGQGKNLGDDWEDYVDGRIFLGKDALTHGFVDELGDFETAVARAKKLAKIPNANLVRYDQPFDLSHLLRWLVKSEKPGIQVNLGLDFPKLQAGRLYLLSPALYQ